MPIDKERGAIRTGARTSHTLCKLVQQCRGCNLYRNATQAVFGEMETGRSERRMSDWRMEDQQVKMAIDGLAVAENADTALDAQKVFEAVRPTRGCHVASHRIVTEISRLILPAPIKISERCAKGE
jgi:hypothetical protein